MIEIKTLKIDKKKLTKSIFEQICYVTAFEIKEPVEVLGWVMWKNNRYLLLAKEGLLYRTRIVCKKYRELLVRSFEYGKERTDVWSQNTVDKNSFTWIATHYSGEETLDEILKHVDYYYSLVDLATEQIFI